MRTLRVCRVEDCDRKHEAQGYCLLHYTRMRRHGDLKLHNRDKDVGYAGAHQRLGSATDYLCGCGSQAQEWSYRGGDPAEKIHQAKSRTGEPALLRYSLDASYYDALCHACHVKRDAAYGAKNGSAKLSESDVQKIRNSGATALELATEYGVSKSHIYRILNNEYWREEVGE